MAIPRGDAVDLAADRRARALACGAIVSLTLQAIAYGTATWLALGTRRR